MRKPRSITPEHLIAIEVAASMIATPQRKLRGVGARKAAAYARCAAKRAEGALRHARRCRSCAAAHDRLAP